MCNINGLELERNETNLYSGMSLRAKKIASLKTDLDKGCVTIATQHQPT